MTARQEMDQMCRATWNELGHDLKATSNSLGRVGLSWARRHPALLLGGGALLGFGAVTLMTRGQQHVRARSSGAAVSESETNDDRQRLVEQRAHQPAKPSKSAHLASGALMHILKNATRMWLLEHLSNQQHGEPQKESDPSELDVPAESPA